MCEEVFTKGSLENWHPVGTTINELYNVFTNDRETSAHIIKTLCTNHNPATGKEDTSLRIKYKNIPLNHITVIEKDNWDHNYDSVTALTNTPTLDNIRSLVGKMNSILPCIICTSLTTNFVHRDIFDFLRDNNIDIQLIELDQVDYLYRKTPQ